MTSEHDDLIDSPLGEEPIELPLDGILDLHLFRPKDAADVVESYLEACRERGVLEVKIIHGKGTGALRRRVQALLERLPWVESFKPAEPMDGGWGATWARLKPFDHSQTL